MACLTVTSVFRAGALAATAVAFGLAPTLALAIGPQTETTPNTPIGKAPITVPAASPSTPAARTDSCTPTTSLLRFDGGYEVSMCYVTPDGVDGQAKAGLYASAESGLLWFFSRDNAEVLVKVLNGCAINGYRWVFVAPVTTLEFDLWVTSPTGERWSHGNTQGETAATKSDVAAFACADEPEAAADLIVSRLSVSDATPVVGRSASQDVAFRSTVLNVPNRGDGAAAATNGREGSASSAWATSSRYHSSPDEAINTSDAFIASIVSDTVAAPKLNVGPQTETTPDTPNGDAPMPSPVSATSPSTPGCTPTTTLLRFDGGYEVSMCYVTPDGVDGQAKAGLYASAESGLLWFFSRDNAEVLVKVLNGCAINGYRWVFVAPVTTLEFDLWVTSPTGVRWTHGNRQGETAATKSDVAAFACADEPEATPDLIVSRVTVSDATPVSGQTITLRATVRNRGDGPATPTTLRFYRSGDSTISASDNSDDLLASDAVAALAASATESRTLDFTVPSTAGTFYLGACIDSVPAESRTGNNCSAGVRVVVDDEPDEGPDDDPDDDPEEPETAPDLTVSSVSVSDAAPVAGQTITLRATVRNRGDGPATPTTLRFHRSDDSTISAADLQLGADAVAALAASATESRTLDFTVPSTAGTFYVGACIDPVSAESRTGNNCSTGVRVVVEDEPDEGPDDDPDDEPDAAPDLIASDFSVSDQNPVAGAVVQLQVTVQNQGDAPATPTTIRYYQSDDSTINMEDTELGTEAAAELAASATLSLTFDFTAPSTPGTFHLGACADSVSTESDTDNNCSVSVLVTVVAPDLTVSDFSVSDENPVAGAVVQLQVTVQNQGDAPATPTTIRYYQSDDSTINMEDTELGTEAVAELAASATLSLTFDFTVPSTADTFYLGACIDSVSDESDTGNNCSTGVLETVEEPPAPDLIVSADLTDATPVAGQTIRLHATVRNSGDAPATPTTLRYYRSDDSTIGPTDEVLGSDTVAALASSAVESRTFFGTAPSPGTFYLGACIDAVSAESNTGNNCSDGVSVVVEPAPDLVVFRVRVTDANPAPGQTINVQATLLNRGDGPASSGTRLRYYRSDDSTISTSDYQLGNDPVAPLAASATASRSLVWAFPSPGTFYLGACIDAVSAESNTGNNCSASVRVVVDDDPDDPEPAPDLIVFAVSVSDANPAPGRTFSLHAPVRNGGGGSASPTTLRYYRSDDSTISTADLELDTDAVAALAGSAAESRTFYGTAPSTPGMFYFGACIDAVSAESDTANNCSDGVRVVVEPVPDLVVSSVSVSDDHLAPEQTIEFRATVLNRGDGAALPTTIRYYRSDDSTIGRRDFELDTDAVEALAASATEPKVLDLTAPSTPGTYYFGACIDTVSAESDTANNCSVGVRVVVEPDEDHVAAPDLIVSMSVSNASPPVGAFFELRATVRNGGDAPASSTTLVFYLSLDSTINTSDVRLAERTVRALDPSATQTTTIDSSVGRAGTYYFGACVDAVAGESDADNNCSDAALVSAR